MAMPCIEAAKDVSQPKPCFTGSRPHAVRLRFSRRSVIITAAPYCLPSHAMSPPNMKPNVVGSCWRGATAWRA